MLVVFWKEVPVFEVIFLGTAASAPSIQRGLSARNESVAQWSAYIAGAMYLTVGMIPVALGIR